MNEDGRFIPPGPARTAAFSHAGGFGKSRLFTVGCGLLSGATVAYFLKSQIRVGLENCFRSGMDNTLLHRLPTEVFGEFLQSAGVVLSPLAASTAVGLMCGALLPALAARRGKGVTVVPLPKMPRAAVSIGALRVFGAVVFGLAFLLSVRGIQFETGSLSGWIDAFGALTWRFVALLGGMLMFVGAAEVLLLRYLSYRALFLTQSEFRRELRNQEGARAMSQAGRAEVRRGGAQ